MPVVPDIVWNVECDQALNNSADEEADTRQIDLPADCGKPSWE